MKKYFKRIFIEAKDEIDRYGLKSLPFIEALAIMIIVSRGMAEAIEIFPYSISVVLTDLAYKWLSGTVPILNRVYGSIGYVFAPDVALIPIFPFTNPVYPKCVLMISLWLFSILYTFAYWLSLTGLSYFIVRILGGGGSYLRLLIWIGLAHIPLINWWFYTGCEMLYELKEQEIYMSLLPPYNASSIDIRIDTPWGSLPSYLPVEGFWVGYGFGVFSMILAVGLIITFIYMETGLKFRYALLASLPWIIYLILLIYGSMNITSINNMLYKYVKEGLAWSWFGR